MATYSEEGLLPNTMEGLLFMQIGCTNGGYDPDLFIEPTEDFICMICHGVVRDPVILVTCGHLFCGECTDHLEVMRCPLDSGGITVENIQKEKFIHRLTQKRKVRCPLSKRKCDWEGELSSLHDHLLECERFMIPCGNEGCGAVCERKDNKIHREICTHTIIKCTWCDTKLERLNYDSHINTNCPLFPIVCPNYCGIQELERKDMQSHLLECPNAKHLCEFHQLGCYQMFESCDMDAHLENNNLNHISLLKNAMIQVLHEHKALKVENQKLSDEKKELARHLAEMNAALRQGEKKYSEMKKRESEMDERVRTIERVIFQKTRQDDVHSVGEEENYWLESISSVDDEMPYNDRNYFAWEQNQIPNNLAQCHSPINSSNTPSDRWTYDGINSYQNAGSEIRLRFQNLATNINNEDETGTPDEDQRPSVAYNHINNNGLWSPASTTIASFTNLSS